MIGVMLAVSGSAARHWFEQLERDIIHFLACHVHRGVVGEFLEAIQSKSLMVPVVVVVLVLYAFRDRRRALRAFLTAGIAFSVCSLLGHVLWATVDRERPPHHFDRHLVTPAEQAGCASDPEALPLHFSASKRPSFPSRHGMSVGVFVAALFLASRWMGFGAAVIGLCVMIGRVSVARHWPTDVVAGALIGAFVAWFVWRTLPPFLDRFGLAGAVQAPPEAATSPAGSGGEAG